MTQRKSTVGRFFRGKTWLATQKADQQLSATNQEIARLAGFDNCCKNNVHKFRTPAVREFSMYSLREAAIMLGLTKSKIRSLIDQGKLKSFLVDDQEMIDKADLYKFIRLNMVPAKLRW